MTFDSGGDGGLGTSAYVDYVANPIAQAMAEQGAGSAMSSVDIPNMPLNGEVLPPERGPASMTTEEAAQYLIQQAEKQRKAAGNPLNRILSAVGGVVAAPLNFVAGALSNDMGMVTRPFTPQQNADQRFYETVMGVNKTLESVRAETARAGASQASQMSSLFDVGEKQKQAGYDELGRFISPWLYVDPARRADLASKQLPALAIRYPFLEEQIKFLQENNFNPESLATVAALSKDEGVKSRVNEYLYGNKTIPTGDGTFVTLSSRPGAAPQFFDRGSSEETFRTLSPTPYINTPAPAAAAAPTPLNTSAPEINPQTGFPRALSPAQYEATVNMLGKDNTDAWMQRNGIQMAPAQQQQPQGPVQIKGVEDYNALPPGAVYIDPTGKQRIKGQ